MSWNDGNANGAKCPCRGCADREIGCHGKCEKYAEYKAEIERKRHADKLFDQSRRTMSAAASKRITREKGRKNKKRMHTSYDT